MLYAAICTYEKIDVHALNQITDIYLFLITISVVPVKQGQHKRYAPPKKMCESITPHLPQVDSVPPGVIGFSPISGTSGIPVFLEDINFQVPCQILWEDKSVKKTWPLN